VLLHYFPTQAPWLNPMESVIGMIIRYGLKNKTHQKQMDCLWHNRNTENGGVKIQR
jgi:hypothetical protein